LITVRAAPEPPVKPSFDYDEEIVVAVVYRGILGWLVTPMGHWFLDHRRLRQSPTHAQSLAAADDAPPRFGIEVLDETTVDAYLRQDAGYLSCRDDLSEWLRRHIADGHQLNWEDTLPVLLVDFDARRLVSRHPDPSVRFEDFVPAGWTGEHRSFLDELPAEQRYWIVDGRDYSPVARPNTPLGRRLSRLLAAELAALLFCLAAAFLLHRQGRKLPANRFGGGVLAMFGALVAGAVTYSFERYGVMGSGSRRLITRRSHPTRYRIYTGAAIAIGLAIFLTGLFVALGQ